MGKSALNSLAFCSLQQLPSLHSFIVLADGERWAYQDTKAMVITLAINILYSSFGVMDRLFPLYDEDRR